MELLLIIFGIAALVWSVVLFRWGGLMIGCLGVILAGCCFGHPFFHASVVTIDRALLGVVVVLFLLLGRFGLAEHRPFSRYDLALTVVISHLTFSVFSHDWTINDAQPLATLLFFYFMPAALYWIVRDMTIDEHYVRMAFVFFAGFGVYLGLTGVAERFDVGAVVFPRYIMSVDHVEFLGRARGPFLNPIGLGIYLTTCVACAMMCWPKADWRGKGLVIFAVVAASAGCFCTMTRSVWIGLGAGMFLIVACTIPKTWRIPFAMSICVAGSVVVIAKWNNLNSFKRDKQVSVEDMEESAKLRPILAAIAWRMFQDHPWIGVGSGQYLRRNHEYVDDRSTDLILSKGRVYVQHNVFLAQLVENGSFGLALYLVMLTTWIWRAISLWRSTEAPLWIRQCGLVLLATMCSFCINGLFHDVAIITMVNYLMFFLAGLNHTVWSVIGESIEIEP